MLVTTIMALVMIYAIIVVAYIQNKIEFGIDSKAEECKNIFYIEKIKVNFVPVFRSILMSALS